MTPLPDAIGPEYVTYADLLALRDKHDKKPRGFVYFMAQGNLDGEIHIKIGWTQDMRTRFKVFLRESFGSWPVLIIRGSRSVEKLAHRLFKKQRERGEWFRLEGDLHWMLHDFGGKNWEPEAWDQLIECWLLAT